MVAAVTTAALFSELDAVDERSAERCGQILHRVADLFISRAPAQTPHEIEVFDDVLVRLVGRGETASLVKLSRKLADIKRSLPKTDRQLALHESAMVSVPVLQSCSLSKELLIEVAQSQGQQHLKAIAGRHSLEPSIATILVQRGDSDVHHMLVRNR